MAGSAEAEVDLRISVVIPHLNQPDALRRCLASIAAGRRKPDEVIVVDNGSTERPDSVCAQFPDTTLLSELTPGPGPARNRGAAAASGNILAFIDADCTADPGWLEAAEAALRDPEVTVIGGDVRIALSDPARLTVLEAYESVYAYRMDRYIAREGFTGTGNLVMRRRVLDEVGPFAGLGIAEDRDWGQRATSRGYRTVYLPAMRVYHPARNDFADLFRKWDRHVAHDFAALSGPTGRMRWVAKMLALVVSPVAEIPRILTCDRISGPRSRALAFAGMVRVRLYRARVMFWLARGGDPAALTGGWNRPAIR
ncbi:MAG: glycosyltransferase family 2 protein [Gemmobacter sp.]